MIEPRRYFPAVAIGGGIAGVVTAIPVLGDLLRCCFCIGVMAGAAVSMKLWLDTHQAENLAPADAMTLGGTSGAVSAAVTWIVALPIRLVFGEGLSRFYEGASLPDVVRDNLRALYAPGFGMVIMSLPLQVALFGVMGAVGAFIALQTAFKDRKEEA